MGRGADLLEGNVDFVIFLRLMAYIGSSFPMSICNIQFTSIFTQHLHNIYTTFTQHLHNIYTTFTQHLLLTQHLHNITIFHFPFYDHIKWLIPLLFVITTRVKCFF